jgi:hypothetical protein
MPSTEKLNSRRRPAFDLQRVAYYIETDFLYRSCTTNAELSVKLVQES